jgi:DNA-binding LacI/PurR family transcriptional regulator
VVLHVHPHQDPLQAVGAGQVLGAIAVGSTLLDARIRRLLTQVRSRGAPVAISAEELPNRTLAADHLDADRVTCDHADGRRRIVEWLHRRGRQHLQLIGHPGITRHNKRWWAAQEDGHRRACRDLGLRQRPVLMPPDLGVPLNPASEDAYAWLYAGMLRDRYPGNDVPDTLLAPTDALVPVLARALRIIGCTPDQVWLAGYDGYADKYPWMRAWCQRQQVFPRVSVRHPAQHIGHTLATLVLTRLAGRSGRSAVQRSVEMPLVIGGG